MFILNFIKKLLSEKTKLAIVRMFPFFYRFYERRFILKTLGFKNLYEKIDDSLHIGNGVLPLKMICDTELVDVGFNAGFIDLVCPFIDETGGVNHPPFFEGPYVLDNVKVEHGDIIFDCGANIGLFSVAAGYHDCTCYAFEPMPGNIKHLNKIIQVNPHIILAPYAIGNEVGTVRFETTDGIDVATKITSDDSSNSIEVDCLTLDYFVEKNNIKHVDFIKADIEGAERWMLEGARGILKEFAPKLSLCTYHLPDDPQVMRELILDANPNYIIEEKYKKMYAYVPK